MGKFWLGGQQGANCAGHQKREPGGGAGSGKRVMEIDRFILDILSVRQLWSEYPGRFFSTSLAGQSETIMKNLRQSCRFGSPKHT